MRSRIRSSLAFALAATALAVAATAAPAFAQGKAVEPGAATAEGFLPSSACGCHGDLVAQWQGSMHAKAIVDPVFLVKVKEAEEQAGEEVAKFCKRCHTPIGNMLSDFNGTGDVAKEGVTCMFCHQVTGLNEGEPGNTSHIVEANLTRRAQIKDPTAPHPATYSELHESAEFCGGCHNVNHPTNGTHLEASYTEWEEGPYAEKGVVCQDCHMSEGPGVVGPSKGVAGAGGPERDNIYAMTFIGANVAQGDAEAATALLKSAAKVEMQVADIVAAGETASMTVTITNSGAGHYLPTGLTEVRQMWLAVWAEGDDGTRVDLGEHRFGTELKDEKGEHPTEVWAATDIATDDRIAPLESVTDEFDLAMPANAERMTVKAALNYKSMPDDLASAAGVQNPVTEMAAATKDVFATQAAMDAFAADASKVPAEEPAEEPEGGSGSVLPIAAIGIVAAIAIAVAFIVKGKKKTGE